MHPFKKLVAAWALGALPACAAAPAPVAAVTQPAAEPFVIAANPLAAEAGLNVLKRGGSAVDAAIGARVASSSSRVVSGAMGPIPDEPATVTCGA